MEILMEPSTIEPAFCYFNVLCVQERGEREGVLLMGSVGQFGNGFSLQLTIWVQFYELRQWSQLIPKKSAKWFRALLNKN
ncbi:hypothetical protein BVC80_8997g4 [Macleaya cordata]|uniref:Uncharacterized protein n=1 Tax=Macleaya cordata TaxID=56857 RepID=A0A200QME4_MACCD|nr:hypothetical protein BVC80_8997g4 [Macleaya cordata]